MTKPLNELRICSNENCNKLVIRYSDEELCEDCRAKSLRLNSEKNPTESTEGEKRDKGKFRYSLLPWKQIASVVDVLEFGAKKYSPDNWQKVPELKTRYFDAAMRHVLAWRSGEKSDSESRLPHLAHAVCCLLFLMWSDDNE